MAIYNVLIIYSGFEKIKKWIKDSKAENPKWPKSSKFKNTISLLYQYWFNIHIMDTLYQYWFSVYIYYCLVDNTTLQLYHYQGVVG